MKRTLLSLAILAAMSTSAMAGGIGIGNTTNDNRDYSTTNQGGHGGNATAGAVAGAASVSGSKSSVTSTNLNVVSANSNNAVGVTVQGDQAAKIPVSSATSAGLTAANGTCLGSASGGAQGPGFGVTFGSTKLDDGCDTRYDVATLQALGLHTAAVARACQKPEMAAAMGSLCPSKAKADAKVSGYTGNDPYVLQRLGAQ